jgi:hypothetical protein
VVGSVEAANGRELRTDCVWLCVPVFSDARTADEASRSLYRCAAFSSALVRDCRCQPLHAGIAVGPNESVAIGQIPRPHEEVIQ